MVGDEPFGSGHNNSNPRRQRWKQWKKSLAALNSAFSCENLQTTMLTQALSLHGARRATGRRHKTFSNAARAQWRPSSSTKNDGKGAPDAVGTLGAAGTKAVDVVTGRVETRSSAPADSEHAVLFDAALARGATLVSGYVSVRANAPLADAWNMRTVLDA